MILQLKNVESAYGLSQILFGVNLEVREGEVCCLLGRNGVGKSTTIHNQENNQHGDRNDEQCDQRENNVHHSLEHPISTIRNADKFEVPYCGCINRVSDICAGNLFKGFRRNVKSIFDLHHGYAFPPFGELRWYSEENVRIAHMLLWHIAIIDELDFRSISRYKVIG